MDICWLGIAPYQQTWQAMLDFTQQRTAETADKLWICQHPSVFTQGQAGDAKHIGALGDIPLIQTDRGGQVTFHGIGQWVFYPLVDLTRRKIGVKAFVSLLEQVTIDTLSRYEIIAERLDGAPGLYVNGMKIASLGLKIKRGCSYHGLSLNTDMDLQPFQRITPCGLANMQVTQVSFYNKKVDQDHLAQTWCDLFCKMLNDLS